MVTPFRHPLLVLLDRIEAGLDDTEAYDPMYLPTADREELTRRLAVVRDRMDARLADTLAVSDDVAEERAARSAGVWLARERQLQPGRMVAAERLGKRLRTHPVTATAAGSGAITADHARAVLDAIDELPDDIPGYASLEARAELLERAERDLVKLCDQHTPKEIRRLGRRILEAVAPEAADEIERRLLENEERRAQARTEFRLNSTGQGTTRIRGEIPDVTADILRRVLDSYTNPRRADVPAEGLTFAQRQGQAFCALIESLDPDGVPQHGGSPVGVVVTVDWTLLRDGVGAAQLDTGQRLSVAAVRRLACQHGVLPAVLGGTGKVLDLGRKQRLFTPAQREAHAVQHATCQAEGCPVPSAWTEAHHKNEPWSEGGTTDLDDLAFLCGFHHQRAHDPTYEVTWSSSGTARFRRRE